MFLNLSTDLQEGSSEGGNDNPAGASWAWYVKEGYPGSHTCDGDLSTEEEHTFVRGALQAVSQCWSIGKQIVDGDVVR